MSDTTPALVEGAVRLARLLETPADIDELGPLIVRAALEERLTSGSERVA